MFACRLVREQLEKGNLVPMSFLFTGHGKEVAKMFFLLLACIRRSRFFPNYNHWTDHYAYQEIDTDLLSLLQKFSTGQTVLFNLTRKRLHFKKASQPYHPPIEPSMNSVIRSLPPPSGQEKFWKCSLFCLVSI